MESIANAITPIRAIGEIWQNIVLPHSKMFKMFNSRDKFHILNGIHKLKYFPYIPLSPNIVNPEHNELILSNSDITHRL